MIVYEDMKNIHEDKTSLILSEDKGPSVLGFENGFGKHCSRCCIDARLCGNISSLLFGDKTSCFFTERWIISSCVPGDKPGCFKGDLRTSPAIFVSTKLGILQSNVDNHEWFLWGQNRVYF